MPAAAPVDDVEGVRRRKAARQRSCAQMAESARLMGAAACRLWARTSSYLVLPLLLVAILFTHGVEIYALTTTKFYSPFRSASYTTPPPDYPYVPDHPLTCTTFNLTCPANYPTPIPARAPPDTCPDYFRWIHEDLQPWRDRPITREMVEEVVSHRESRHFRLVVVNGTAYVRRYDPAYQTRDVFTLWGVLQLLKMYPGRIPDLDLVFQCHDSPSIYKAAYPTDKDPPPPLFHYCGSDSTYDIVFPDWSFWGWPEVNVKPWPSLRKDLEEGNKKRKWREREPYAYWRGSLYTGPRAKLIGNCNSTKDYSALIYHQNWEKERQEGFKNSDMSKQCKHRYKIYMEGNAWSVSEKYVLACDAMSLLVNPSFYDFFTRSLVPLKHYWPIDPKNVCQSLKFAVEWGEKHLEKAQEIGKAGSRFVVDQLTMKNVYDYMFHVLSEYGKLLAYRPTIPEGSVELCSESWACTLNELERKYKMETLVEGGPSTLQPCDLPPPFEPRYLEKLRGQRSQRIKHVANLEKELARASLL